MNEILTRWRKVCEAATEGPWEFERIAHDSGEFAYERNDDHALMVLREANYEKPMKAKFDAEFIALSRTALPVAIQVIEEMDKELVTIAEYLKSTGMDKYEGEWAPPEAEIFRSIVELRKQIHARLESCK